jgi:hypothetical protein
MPPEADAETDAAQAACNRGLQPRVFSPVLGIGKELGSCARRGSDIREIFGALTHRKRLAGRHPIVRAAAATLNRPFGG